MVIYVTRGHVPTTIVEPPDSATDGATETVKVVELFTAVTVVPVTKVPVPAVTITPIPTAKLVVVVTVMVVLELVAPAADVYRVPPPLSTNELVPERATDGAWEMVNVVELFTAITVETPAARVPVPDTIVITNPTYIPVVEPTVMVTVELVPLVNAKRELTPVPLKIIPGLNVPVTEAPTVKIFPAILAEVLDAVPLALVAEDAVPASNPSML